MNKSNKTFENWNLIEGHPRDFYFLEMINKSNSLTVLLKKIGSQDEVLKIEFLGVLTYRYTIEAARTKTINDNQFLELINRTNNSSYLSWFKDESGELFNATELVHVLICSSDCLVETITNEVPNISWIRN